MKARKIKKSASALIVVSLVLAIGALGVIIWGEVNQKPTIFDPMVRWLEKTKNQATNQGFVTRRERLTLEERAIFRTPTASSSAAERKSYYDLVVKQAVEGQKLVVNECLGDPLSLKVKNGLEIEIQNNDSHVIKIRLKNLMAKIEGGSTGKLKVDLEQNGVYVYSCESSIGRLYSGGAILVI